MTNTFTDALGREWTLKFSMRTMGVIKKNLSLDIASPDGIENYCQLASSDRSKFVDVLWTTVEGDAVAKGVTEESFHEGLDGEALHNAELALNEAFLEWQHPQARDAVRKAIGAHEAALKATGEYIVATLDSPSFNAELDRKIKEAFKPAAVAV